MENFFNAARSALVLLAFFASWTQAAPIVMDEIAAIVDDDIIARSEIENRLATIKAQAAIQRPCRQMMRLENKLSNVSSSRSFSFRWRGGQVSELVTPN